MHPKIAIIAPGVMGASLGAKVAEHGGAASTVLSGRGAASAARAAAAGMSDASLAEVIAGDFILSVVPPDQAMRLAESIAEAAQGGGSRAIFVDCNALAPESARRVGDVVTASGLRFVDGGIIGLPARPGSPGPAIFVSGPHAAEVGALAALGLDIRVLDGPVGAASALKMSYAGVTKGMIALGSMMILGAKRAGVDDALHRELALSQPDLLKRFSKAIPDMFSKAKRWAPEMEEISTFLGDGRPEQQIFLEIARLYERLAGDAGKAEIAVLKEFFGDGD